jgi:hypothetical protein
MTARQHLAAAFRHLVAALAATETDDYQQHREPPVPIGALKSSINILAAYSVDPIQR